MAQTTVLTGRGRGVNERKEENGCAGAGPGERARVLLGRPNGEERGTARALGWAGGVPTREGRQRLRGPKERRRGSEPEGLFHFINSLSIFQKIN